jgi:hypothetical protein
LASEAPARCTRRFQYKEEVLAGQAETVGPLLPCRGGVAGVFTLCVARRKSAKAGSQAAQLQRIQVVLKMDKPEALAKLQV